MLVLNAFVLQILIDLLIFLCWCRRNTVDLILKPSITEVKHHPPLFFNGTPVTNVKDHKHLGLILESKLSLDKHVNE